MQYEKKQQIIEVLPYNVEWATDFEFESKLLEPIFQENFFRIHHIGSTAIPGMMAKPTIDMLLEVKNIDLVNQCNKNMQIVGYEAWGEYGIPGRCFFVKGEDKRTHHLHVFLMGSAQVNRHLYFRDYLIAYPDKAKEYAQLKVGLARRYKNNRRKYFLGKQKFVEALELRAINWFSK